MGKPRLAIFDFACCEGCQLQVVNMEEEILDLISVVDPVEWREGMSEQSDEYDVAVIEGSITRPQDEERIKKIREKAKVLIAIGACATTGGVNRLKNNFTFDDVKQCVYKDKASMPHLDTAKTKAVGEVVKVDFVVHGCPMERKEFTYVVRSALLGKKPSIPTFPVCVECKRKENICRYEYNELCLGPLTRAGCGARRPSSGFWCFGCRGYAEEPNVAAAKEVMHHYNKSVDDLKDRMFLFNSDREHTNE